METRRYPPEILDPRALRRTSSKSQRLSLEPRRPSAALAVHSCVAHLRSSGLDSRSDAHLTPHSSPSLQVLRQAVPALGPRGAGMQDHSPHLLQGRAGQGDSRLLLCPLHREETLRGRLPLLFQRGLFTTVLPALCSRLRVSLRREWALPAPGAACRVPASCLEQGASSLSVLVLSFPNLAMEGPFSFSLCFLRPSLWLSVPPKAF